MAIEAVSDIKRAGTSAFSAGSGAFLTASITVAPSFYQVDNTVANASVLSTSKILCQLAPNADWDADDLAEFEVFATPADGSVVFTITRPGPIVGEFLILYILG